MINKIIDAVAEPILTIIIVLAMMVLLGMFIVGMVTVLSHVNVTFR